MKFTYSPGSHPLEGYTIKRAIQRGGFGEVYFALSDAGKQVALKLLHDGDNAEVELRGVSECLNLKHNNLLTIFDVRQTGAHEYWIVMEYVDGDTLDQTIAHSPHGMPIDKAAGLLAQMAAGVDYLHDKGIVHRDLKPANIHVEHGVIKIGDVGLAKFISESQRSDQTQSVGTVYYMAPEIAHGRYGREVDVYALGIILYEMLTGRVPFDGESTGEILMKQLSQPPDLSVLPVALQPVLQHVLEKDPLKRTGSAGQLLEEFQRATGLAGTGTQVASSADGPSHRPYEPVRRAQVAPTTPHPRAVRLNDQRPQGADGEHRAGVAVDAPRLNAVALTIGAILAVLLALVVLQMTGGGNRASLGLVGILVLLVAGVAGVVASRGQRRHGDASAQGHHPRARRLNTGYVRYHGSGTVRSLSIAERLAELTGSMAVAGVCASALAFTLFLTNSFVDSHTKAILFAAGTTAAAWAAIIPGKAWEGRGGDGVTRRLTTGLAGLLAGVAVFAVDHQLHVDLPAHSYGRPAELISNASFLNGQLNADDASRLVAYMTFFGMLMFVRRWWHHVDSFRGHRIRLLSICATAMAGLIVAAIGHYPLDWAVMWAVAGSAAAQAAAVWVPLDQRPSQVSA